MGKLSKVIASALVSIAISVAGFSVSVNAQDISSWQTEVKKKVAKKQKYPRAALRKELQGQAKVEINVDREGNIVAHNLQASTGHDILDKEVPKLMKRASPLPAPPAEATDGQLTMVIPLAWVLQ